MKWKHYLEILFVLEKLLDWCCMGEFDGDGCIGWLILGLLGGMASSVGEVYALSHRKADSICKHLNFLPSL